MFIFTLQLHMHFSSDSTHCLSSLSVFCLYVIVTGEEETGKQETGRMGGMTCMKG